MSAKSDREKKIPGPNFHQRVAVESYEDLTIAEAKGNGRWMVDH